MQHRSRHEEEHELLPRTSSDSISSSSSSSSITHKHYFPKIARSRLLRLYEWIGRWKYSQQLFSVLAWANGRWRPRTSRRLLLRGLCLATLAIFCAITLSVIFTVTFLPSYSHLPNHYRVLQKRCEESAENGRGNINNEKVFIAASLHDPGGALLNGDWGRAIAELVELLGSKNVHLSIYENDADPAAKAALDSFGSMLNCTMSLVSEHLPIEEIPRRTIPTGESLTSRIAFLAEVRNRALRPLHSDSTTRFDKLLYINDVIFHPIDAVHLLFSTNVGASGRTDYGAACAVDFINPFKFYDRYATRDLEGYTTGIPFFPWFTDAGSAGSRKDVLAQKDAVRVRSCWGGMTAFEAKWFQDSLPDSALSTGRNGNGTTDFGFDISPLHFRYEDELFWEASECCLVHADLTYLRHGNESGETSGNFMNPYIRVAYDSSTLGWIPYTRRVERLYSVIHNLLNHLVGMPESNPRRLENPGDKVTESVWMYNNKAIESLKERKASAELGGSFHKINRAVGPGRFCGDRGLMVLRENPKEGEKRWMKIMPPTLPD